MRPASAAAPGPRSFGAGLLLALGLSACATPARDDGTPAALSAPAPAPPGHLPLGERIRWTEERLADFSAPDRSEAQLALGELYLEARRPRDARLALREAQYGDLSRRETARAERGIGLSYLLDRDSASAKPHLRTALAGLDGPDRKDTEYLLARLDGHEPAGVDAGTLARVSPYLGFRSATGGSSAPVAKEASALFDVSRVSWRAQPMAANHDPMTRIYRLTVHHTAEPLVDSSLAASKAEVLRVQGIHQKTNGWADIGYHFLIDRGGRVYQGRPLTTQGAHAGDPSTNRGNVGVCLLGNFEAQPDRGSKYANAQQPTAAQLEALEELVGSLRGRHSIQRSEVWPHSHFNSTDCPGPVLEQWVRAYRAGADNYGS
ncbi:MAG TPA: peptidoglycan recognition family protein [Planctomycetota bacterium]